MRHSQSYKPESIANAKSEIQIVDTLESFKALINIGITAGMPQINRTLLT
jgi:hypothetical protein